MPAHYVEWQMRRALAPTLFDEDDRIAAEANLDALYVVHILVLFLAISFCHYLFVACCSWLEKALASQRTPIIWSATALWSATACRRFFLAVAVAIGCYPEATLELLATAIALQSVAFRLLQITL